ncbi:DUF5081 family protein [uncultured Enterococcus sp.]|uniref:DUF5081 family protein n=1 Tax=uncultured Enterococcus sp. TaxID=167972 RepID=UPI002AA76768|nr:DUF5081 family protein [uncultured Enterococcus sp.]
MMENQTFSFGELCLLAEAFDVTVIFGLPDKKTEVLFDSAFITDAGKALQEKRILDEENHLTEAGFFVVRALEEYCASGEYVRLNNLMIGFSADKKRLIVLSEVVADEAYKLVVYDTLSFLKELYETVPMIAREPLAEDIEYTMKKLRNATRREWNKDQFDEEIVNLEIFSDKDLEDENNHVQWLFFEKDEKLAGIDITAEKYYQFSQYYFMKLIFEALHISLEALKEL